MSQLKGLPAGVLRNLKTKRFHVIFFTLSSKSGNKANKNSSHFKSFGHTAKSYLTLREAKEIIEDYQSCYDTRIIWLWNPDKEEDLVIHCNFSS